MNSLTMFPVRHPDALWRLIGDETLVLRVDSGRMGVLNLVGTRMWELMDGTRSMEQIAGECAAEYQVERERVEQDLLDYAQRLLERDLISMASGAPMDREQ